MIEAWRVVKKKHAANAFSGEGARRFGGRWNHPGTRMVYLGGSLALAALETFVHIARAETSIEYVSIRVRIPKALISEPPALPRDWRKEPPPQSTKDMGTEWVKRGTSAVLKVPSAMVPVEHNYLLNPGHPDSSKISIGAHEPFGFDPRMLK